MIMITGATGMLGAHLAMHLLETHQQVRAICRDMSATEKTRGIFRLYGKESLYPKIQWVIADILDIPSLESAFDGTSHVYHCAAHVSFDPADEEILRKTNIEGTANIVNLCLAHNIKKLCYVSSIVASGDLKPQEFVVTEETEWNPEKPHSDYAISKHGGEMEIWRGRQEGLQTVIINPGVILGPGGNTEAWKSGSPALFSRVAGGTWFYTRGATGFVDVLDVVVVLQRLMESDIDNDQFIVVADNVAFKSVLDTIAQALSVPEPRFLAKPWMASAAWRLDKLFSLFGHKRHLSREMARALQHRDEFSNRRITETLNYTFRDINETIARIAAQYQK